MDDLSRGIEYRDLQPGIAAAVSGRPDHRGDPLVSQVEARGCWRNGTEINILRAAVGSEAGDLCDRVDARQEPDEFVIRGFYRFAQIIRETDQFAVGVADAPDQPDASRLQASD